MIWVVKKFIAHQTLEGGGDWVKFPIRVELEYQQEGMKVSEGPSRKKILYYKSFLLKRYLGLKDENWTSSLRRGFKNPLGRFWPFRRDHSLNNWNDS
jgi:hypothetical protein